MSKKSFLPESEFNKHKLIEAIYRSAQRHLDSAEHLAQKGTYPDAYVHLVYALEECAKERICMMFDRPRPPQSGPPKDGIPLEDQIDEEKFNKVFSDHNDKYVTLATQAIFDGPHNTFDKKLKIRINDAIRKGDPSLAPELIPLMKTFANLHTLRLEACYVGPRGPLNVNFKEEYENLLPYAKSSLERHNSFALFKNIKYKETEAGVKKMLGRYKQNSKKH